MDSAFDAALLRAIVKARPVGVHKHFHLLAVQRSMSVELGEDVDAREIWSKLGTLYNLQGLDRQVSAPSLAISRHLRSSPIAQDIGQDDFLTTVEQFELPHEPEYVEIWQRRAFVPPHYGASPPASPVPTPEDEESSLSEADADGDKEAQEAQESKQSESRPQPSRRRTSNGRYAKNQQADDEHDEHDEHNNDQDIDLDDDNTNTRSSRSRSAKAAQDAPKKPRGGRPKATRGRTSSTRSNPKRREWRGHSPCNAYHSTG